MWLEAQERADALAVSGQEEVWLGGQPRQVNTVLAAWPSAGWTRPRAGAGATGPWWYAGYWRPWAAPMPPAWRRWRLGRRSVSEPTALPALVVFAPQTATRAEAVPVAGTRWMMESRCEAAQGDVGWDHEAGRSGTGWYRHIPLAMWA
jgi:hypothetical protein